MFKNYRPSSLANEPKNSGGLGKKQMKGISCFSADRKERPNRKNNSGGTT
jgi:hypothetical protein